jgi:hypothetical protein
MTTKQRQEVETRLANYNIPVQILQMVADKCECVLDTSISGKDRARKPKLPTLLARLNDKSIMLLQQIFLDCQDSFSNFRFAVFLSSSFSPMMHKYVMDTKISGISKLQYSFDVCIYRRETEELVAVGMQNKDESQQASDDTSLRKFLAAIKDLRALHPSIYGAYYASSYGYENSNPSRLVKGMGKEKEGERKMEIKFFEYKNTIYFESKPRSH